ncbi:saccharopine dehydrogenase NADP-binding domain-containing protein, partial [bacterium]|nr:saccharopine dehydrogenase NADP-binding domain-containing protein [bacterium]
MKMTKEFDVIVWGASGFTGRLVAAYLYKQYGVNGSLKWAMAGRNLQKLEEVRKAVADKTVPLVIADSDNEESLKELVLKTKV